MTTVNYDKIDFLAKVNCGFRLLTDYVAMWDSLVLRIDVKFGDKQYAVGLSTSAPIKPKSGDKVTPFDDLISPPGYDCLNVKVNKEQLISALRQLADKLEKGE